MMMESNKMQNCLIMGSGRSGTSMVAGTLSSTGYFMGEDLIPPRDCNPKGFFESPEINEINEDIIRLSGTNDDLFLNKILSNYHPGDNQRWLSRISTTKTIRTNSAIEDRIANITQRSPFCFKDPRFSYTLPIWRKYLKNTVYICVFRHPAETAASIIKEVNDSVVLKGLPITTNIALDIWQLMYEHILVHQKEGNWLFLHYNQVLTAEGLGRLERFTGAHVDYTFPESALRRSMSSFKISRQNYKLYQRLCELASYKE